MQAGSNKAVNTVPKVGGSSRNQPTDPHPKVQRVLAAVDLSGRSKATAVYATGIARRFDAALTLVHAFDPEGITQIAGDRVYDSLDDARRDAKQRLSSLVEKIRQFYPKCDMEFRIGSPTEQIEIAVHLVNADLVVIASHHPASLVFATDQAQEISRNLSCPVLVYHGGGAHATAARKWQPLDGSAQPAVS